MHQAQLVSQGDTGQQSESNVQPSEATPQSSKSESDCAAASTNVEPSKPAEPLEKRVEKYASGLIDFIPDISSRQPDQRELHWTHFS